MFPKNCQEKFIYSAWGIYLAMAFLCLKNKGWKVSKSLILEALPTTKNDLNCETLNKGVHRSWQYTYSEEYSFCLASIYRDHQFTHGEASVWFKNSSGKGVKVLLCLL